MKVCERWAKVWEQEPMATIQYPIWVTARCCGAALMARTCLCLVGPTGPGWGRTLSSSLTLPSPFPAACTADCGVCPADSGRQVGGPARVHGAHPRRRAAPGARSAHQGPGAQDGAQRHRQRPGEGRRNSGAGEAGRAAIGGGDRKGALACVHRKVLFRRAQQ